MTWSGSPEVPRPVVAAAYLLYGTAALMLLVGLSSLLDLPGPFTATRPETSLAARATYLFLLILPVALLTAGAGRASVAARWWGRVVGTVLALVVALGAWPYAMASPVSFASAWVAVGVAVVVLLWAPSTWSFFGRPRRPRR